MSLPIVGQNQPLTTEEVAARIRAALPDARVEVVDLTGTRDHFHARVFSETFAGKSLVQQHQAVYRALATELQGPIHALKLETGTLEDAR